MTEKDFSLRLAKLREEKGVSARDMSLLCCSAQSRKYPDCLERTQKSGRHGRWLFVGNGQTRKSPSTSSAK